MTYTKQEGRFLSADNETEVYYAVYRPQGNPKAIVQICHGMYEYIERYEKEGTVEALTSAGLIVCGNDHLGHGRTVSGDKSLGHFHSYRNAVDDLHTLNGILRKTYPRLPYLLFGHSMGSLLAREYMVNYEDIDGVALCGTVNGNQPTGLGTALAKLFSFFCGAQTPAPLLRRLSHAGYNKAFAKEENLYSWISSDPSARARYAADRYCTSPFTCAGYREVFSLLGRVSAEDWITRVPLSLPILLLSGEADPVGDNGESARELYQCLEEREVNALDLKLYPNARHELLHEFCRETVIADLLAWIDEVIAGVIACRSYESIPFGRTDFRYEKTVDGYRLR